MNDCMRRFERLCWFHVSMINNYMYSDISIINPHIKSINVLVLSSETMGLSVEVRCSTNINGVYLTEDLRDHNTTLGEGA